MRVFLSIKFHADMRNRARVERVLDALVRAGHEPVCVVRDLEQWGAVQYPADELMRLTFDLIESCDLLLVELTEKGVGLGLEAGFAYSRGIPVVTIAQRGAELSTTLQGISRWTATYIGDPDLDGLLCRLSE